MVEAFIGHIRPQQGESLVNELFDKVIDWLNENGSHLEIRGITNEDVNEIKKLTGNFRLIIGSPHFDEFLIRQEGGPIWSYIGGHISADLRNILKYGFNKEVERYQNLEKL